MFSGWVQCHKLVNKAAGYLICMPDFFALLRACIILSWSCFPHHHGSALRHTPEHSVCGAQSAMIPVVLPGVGRTMYPLAPAVSPQDEKAVQNVAKIADFLLGGQAQRLAGSADPMEGVRLAQELAPFLPAVASEILPEVGPSRVAHGQVHFDRIGLDG